MKICLVYDCLFPHTVGGAERWYGELAKRLAAEGHEVTYLTMRQWDQGEDPGLPGIEVRAVAPRMRLYVGGRRRIAPPLVFGAGVLAHLLARGGRYDVVHTASFPYFSLLAAAAARPLRRFGLVVDWHEVWTREYWRDYLGRAAGAVGYAVQRAGVRVRQRAFCFSRLHAARLRDEGLRGEPTVLEGEYAGGTERPDPEPAEPVVVFAGRQIPEKRASAIIPAIALARQSIPGLRAEIYGDGPDRDEVLRLVRELDLGDAVDAPGFVDGDRVDAALAGALCMLLPSSREGYGLVVVEASARGVPSVVVAGADNAATELIAPGENGLVAPSASPEDLAEAIVSVHSAGAAMRESTADWFAANAERLSIGSSLRTVAESYADARS